MDYAFNKLVTPGIFKLYFKIDFALGSTSEMRIYFYSHPNMLNKATLSLIIFDNDFSIFT
jgi:hypothetical protein